MVGRVFQHLVRVRRHGLGSIARPTGLTVMIIYSKSVSPAGAKSTAACKIASVPILLSDSL